MSPKRAQLVFYYSKKGKPLGARCSACGRKTRAKIVATNGNEIEVYCPTCQSSLLLVANNSELKRILTRAAALIKPRPKKRR